MHDLRDIAETLHDLRQPLSAARLFNATLQSRAPPDLQKDLRALTEGVENSLLAAEELLDGLLDLARLDAGAYHARPVRFPVGPMLDSLELQFAPLARQRSIDFNVQRTRVMAYSDPQLLRRVLQNLISNALRYTQAGQVIVGVRRRRSATLELQVCDTGPGVTLGPSPSPWGEQGHGLGLSICRRIASSLGAELTLQSEPKRGSVFGICIPQSRDAQCLATGLR